MDINLTGQQTEYSTIAPKLLRIKQLMDQRKVIWDRLSDEKKKLWITSNKDPIMSAFAQMIQYACNNFIEIVEHYDGK